MDVKPQIRLTTGETPLSLVSAADIGNLTIVDPINVYEIGVIIVTIGTGTLVLALDKRVTPGSDTGRIDGGVGILSKTVAAGLAVGKVLSKKVNVRLEKGDQIVAEVTTALTGTGIVYVLGYAAGAGAREPDELASA